MKNNLIKHRRILHQIPELSHDLPKTKDYILSILHPLKCEIIEPAPCALCAFFSFGKKTTLAFRSDMDALPIEECNHISYASKHTGRMHACGHDAHMSALLSFAQELHELKSCEHNVMLIFQPAEETTGGALEIVKSGILQRYRTIAVFGFHVWPKLKKGQIATKAGPMMARSAEVTVTIHGETRHIAEKNKGKDALACAVSLLYNLYQKERSVPQTHVLKFGQFQSGTARNAISNQSLLLGTLRTLDDTVFELLKQMIDDAVNEARLESGCDIEVHMNEGYPPLINDPDLVEICVKHLDQLHLLKHANLLSEDFSYYASICPSVFFYLGLGDTPPLHSAHFQFDDTILVKIVNTYRQLLTVKLEEFSKISSGLCQ